MKIAKYATILLALTLFATTAFSAKYRGFKEPEKGEWVIYVMHLDKDSSMEEKLIYLGKETLNRQTVFGVEAQIDMPEMGRMISQFWTNDQTDQGVKYIFQRGGQISCMSAEMPGMENEGQKPMSTKTPEEYSPEKPALRYDTYTTPTGKKVDVAIFKNERGEEVWVSSEVPFGIVKMMKNGKVEMYLKDFGRDAKPMIPVSEALTCKPMDLGQMFGGFGGH
jgi:hypothetical protein